MSTVKVFGAGWCGLTVRTLHHLDSLGIPYQYVDVDEDPAASEWVKSQNNGREKKPTLEIGSRVVTNPSKSQLETILREEQVLK